MAEKPRVTKSDYIPCPKFGELNHPSFTWCEECGKLLASEIEESRFVPGRYVYGGLAVGVVVSAISGGIARVIVRLAWGYSTVELWTQGAFVGPISGGIVGLILAAIGWLIGVTTGKRRVAGCWVWLWAVVNVTTCGGVSFLVSWFLSMMSYCC